MYKNSMKVGENMADKWEWQEQLAKAHMIQAEAGAHIGLSSSQTAHLVKKMVQGQGLTATDTDRKRWNRVLAFIEERQKEVAE
jgi:gluconate kinase